MAANRFLWLDSYEWSVTLTGSALMVLAFTIEQLSGLLIGGSPPCAGPSSFRDCLLARLGDLHPEHQLF
jgi:hypothetical protein